MKREIKNLAEFKELISRYESITLKEIKAKNAYALSLTGFGSCNSCKLCRAVGMNNNYDPYCINCVYGSQKQDEDGDWIYACFSGKNALTYFAIEKAESAESAEELLSAFRNRAKHLRKRYAKLLL